MAENRDGIINFMPFYATRLTQGLQHSAQELERLTDEVAAPRDRLERCAGQVDGSAGTVQIRPHA